MYSVTKRIDFCYGHRLLDYDGICKHPHGHNATAEIEVRADTLDHRGMVVDFGDIKRSLKTWIDREIDHKMVLRRDDPLVKPLQEMGEPVFVTHAARIGELAIRHRLPSVSGSRLNAEGGVLLSYGPNYDDAYAAPPPTSTA